MGADESIYISTDDGLVRIETIPGTLVDIHQGLYDRVKKLEERLDVLYVAVVLLILIVFAFVFFGG